MLYHYTNFDAFKNILATKSLWLVSSLEMSDRTDRIYGNLFCLTSLLKSDKESAIAIKDNLEISEILNLNVETLDADFYSASFCERNDNTFLWNNYASKFKGVCFGFDEVLFLDYIKKITKEHYDKLDDSDEPDDYPCIEKRKVEYGNPIPLFDKALSNATNIWPFKNDDAFYEKECSKVQLKIALMILAGVVKSEDFEKEEEIRFLFRHNTKSDFFGEFKKIRYGEVFKNLGLTDFIKEPKKHVALNIENIFNSKLIPNVFITKDFQYRNELKCCLIDAGLSETKIVLIDSNKMH